MAPATLTYLEEKEKIFILFFVLKFNYIFHLLEDYCLGYICKFL
jgi:hypothetical protein